MTSTNRIVVVRSLSSEILKVSVRGGVHEEIDRILKISLVDVPRRESVNLDDLIILLRVDDRSWGHTDIFRNMSFMCD